MLLFALSKDGLGMEFDEEEEGQSAAPPVEDTCPGSLELLLICVL